MKARTEIKLGERTLFLAAERGRRGQPNQALTFVEKPGDRLITLKGEEVAALFPESEKLVELAA